jgi:aldehyde:ferredoxin oxidoreductase
MSSLQEVFLAGKGIYETADVLKGRYGNKVGISMIGPAGERHLAAAGILNLDKDG